MHVALVGPEIEENLSLRYLAAALEEAGHAWRIVPFSRSSEAKQVARALLRESPEMIALSMVHQKRAGEYLDLITRLRRGGYRGHITAGGHFASLRAHEVLADAPGLDTILHHEGERRLVQLAALLEASGRVPGDLEGITWRGHEGALAHRPAVEVTPLDTLPFPARRRPHRELGVPVAPLVSSRGCAGDCTFCSIRAWHKQVRGARLRLRAPASVAEEMATLHHEHGVRIFIFHDDDFILPRADKALARCHAILDAAAEAIGEPFAFVVKCRPDDVDASLFRYLKSMGLVRVYLGIESHAEGGLATLNRRVTQADNERALRILDELDLYSCSNLLLFDPDTTLEAFEENLEFLARQTRRPFDVARTELYAGAALEQRMISEDRVVGTYRGWDYRIADERVERVFRLFVDVLWDRHFGDKPVTHFVQDLGYRLSLLKRFHPEAVTPEIERAVSDLIRCVNQETVLRLRVLADQVRTHPEARRSRQRADFVRAQRRITARVVREHTRRRVRLDVELAMRWRLAGLFGGAASSSRTASRVLRRVAAVVPATGLSFLLSSCGIPSTVDPAPPPHVEEDPSYGRDLEHIILSTCATADCHADAGPAAAPAAGLLLEEAQGYGQLVKTDSTQVPAMKRVEPNSSENSYLWHKLAGTHLDLGGSGQRMPPEDAPPVGLANLVKEWIDKGAKE